MERRVKRVYTMRSPQLTFYYLYKSTDHNMSPDLRVCTVLDSGHSSSVVLPMLYEFSAS